MRVFCLLLSGLCLTAMLGPLALGHQVALKTGRVIRFEEYRVTENLLLYTDSSGKETKIALNDIDFDHTRELSAGDNPPLDLPGLNLPNRRQTETGAPSPSLGEVAKKLRTTDSKTKAQRVFTDDDVAHSSNSGGAALPQADSSDWRSIADQASSTADSLREMTQGQLQQSALGELASVQFPGRDTWASRLESAKNDLLQVFRDGTKKIH